VANEAATVSPCWVDTEATIPLMGERISIYARSTLASSTPLSADCTDASAASSDASASWNCCFEITPASKS